MKGRDRSDRALRLPLQRAPVAGNGAPGRLEAPLPAGRSEIARTQVAAHVEDMLVALASRRQPSRCGTAPQLGQARVTCITPTSERPSFLDQAVRLFEAQDYDDRELIVVSERRDAMVDRLLRAHPRVRFVQALSGESIGRMRNRACAAATGAYIAHWDDDDWYGRRRLSRQLEPLLSGRADMTGLATRLFLDLDGWRFWTVTTELHRRLFVNDVHAGTLVYRRRVWEDLACYPDVSLREDAALLAAATRRGARLERLGADGLFIYVRHGRNAWRFRCGEHLDSTAWTRADEPPLPPEDRAFYRGQRAVARRSARTLRCLRERTTLVSCIMPTRDRPRLVARAAAYFERQGYPNRELVVVDDGDEPVAGLLPADPSIRYVRLRQRMVLGRKRNIACEHARGRIIVHWDDDDWYAPDRVARQVAELERRPADASGPASVLFFAPASQQAWRYDGLRPRLPFWLAGSGLCYWADTWRRHPFPALEVGEDGGFVRNLPRDRVAVLQDDDLLVAIIHELNTAPKLTSSDGWRPYPLAKVSALLGPDWAFYRGRTAAATDAVAPDPGRRSPRRGVALRTA